MTHTSESRLPCRIVDTIRTWDEAKVVFGQFRACLFRGQRDVRWALQTSLERVTRGRNLRYHETDSLTRFQRKAHAFLRTDSVGTAEIDWLALMQHHGAPTRLLDVTDSAYVAAFFALENAKGPSAIWVFQPHIIINSKRKAEYLGDEDMPYGHGYLKALYKHNVAGVFMVEPFYLSERMRAQQAHFLFPGDWNVGFEDNLLSAFTTEEIAKWVVRIEIPLTQVFRREALADLERMNITRETLFPGLDGLARSLHWYIERQNGELTFDLPTSSVVDLSSSSRS